MPRLLRLLIVLLLLATAGCTGRTARWDDDAGAVAQAEGLLRTGNYTDAMRAYLRLAETSRHPDYYRLKAADAALRAGDGAYAKRLADAVDPGELERPDRIDYTLLQSRLDLNVGRAPGAMAKLDTLAGQRLETAQAVHYHTLRASAYNQLGNMLESARERVRLGPLLYQPEAVQKNGEAIYDTLARLPDRALAGLQPPPPDTLGGWMALTRILRNTAPGRMADAIADWRAHFPGHPADGPFLQSRLQDAGMQVRVAPLRDAPPPVPETPAQPAPPQGPFVGVLLPLSGPYAAAGQAIRTGMVAAYYADADQAKLQLRFVDAQSGDPYALYRKLVDEGAVRVAGPLTKEGVAALAKGGDLPIPVLGLNQIREAEHERLYQFGLTPEDEAEQAAGSAWFDGRQSALVLAPANQFGQRMIKHMVGYWRGLGGKIAAVKTYPYHGQDFASTLKGVFPAPAAAPDQAAAAPAAAQTADFIFLIADSQDARALMPQVAYQGGGNLPVYATSRVYSGKTDAQADQDLNGVTFCDIPWLLKPEEGGSLSVQALEGQIQQTSAEYVKLIAMGMDAYRLLPQLEHMKSDAQYRYAGSTGTLSLQAGNRFQRQLECAQFEGGVPRLRGIAPILQRNGTLPPTP